MVQLKNLKTIQQPEKFKNKPLKTMQQLEKFKNKPLGICMVYFKKLKNIQQLGNSKINR